MLVAGIYVGLKLNLNRAFNKRAFNVTSNRSFNKVNELINYIDDAYVDTISRDDLTDNAVESILNNLDPHSSYIKKEDLQGVNEPLEGNFDGIGVEFNLLNDTIFIITPVVGGPSEKLGILAGDRIIKVEGKNVAGIKITNKEVFKKLRGVSGTKVKVSILRRGSKKLLDFEIIRGKIPITSVDISYMVNSKTGLVKISKFSATTYEEFMTAIDKLKKQGLKNLILDLRGNPGGYLNAASEISDEFLEKGKMIVYTMGKARPKQEYKATDTGILEDMPIAVLIDEGSASASEIVSGALQDNDRGIIIGRRSFGKGLVQEQSDFPDGSAVRLTIARYYTPTGRCIQKPYVKGKHEEYYEDELDRYTSGELTSADSIKLDKSKTFKTPKGKVLYGGGGIMPDVFVPLDTADRSELLNEIVYKGILNQFVITYADEHRKELKKFERSDFVKNYVVSIQQVNELLNFAELKGIKNVKRKLKPFEIEKFKQQVKANLGRMIWNNDGFYPVIFQNDKAVGVALRELK